MNIVCPGCQRRYEIEAEKIPPGLKRAKCKACGQAIPLPDQQPPPREKENIASQRAVCNKCGIHIPYEANFCPRCGDPVTEEDYKQIVPANDSGKIVIAFGYSSSISYSQAVGYSSKFPSYASEGEERRVRHKISFDLQDVESAATLWDIVGSWKSSEMTIAGQKTTKKNLTYGPLGCYRNRQASPNIDQYCYGLWDQMSQNIWGCYRLNVPVFSMLSSWGEFCNFSDRHILNINKKGIQEKLKIGIQENRLCPAFDIQRVAEAFAILPSQIKVDEYSGPFEKFLTDLKNRISYDQMR